MPGLQPGRWGLIAGLLIAQAVYVPDARAQALSGMTGLVATPTATASEVATLTFGASFLHRRTVPIEVIDSPVSEPLHGLAYYATLGYFPFLEVGLRLTHFLDRPDSQGIGDRMISARLRVLPELGPLPALAVGTNDLIGTRKFHTLYAVSSKFLRPGLISSFGLHAGYSWDLLDARQVRLDGAFGGVSLAPVEPVTLLVDHDTKRWNAGVRLRVQGLSLLLAWQDFEVLSGGLSYRLSLVPGL